MGIEIIFSFSSCFVSSFTHPENDQLSNVFFSSTSLFFFFFLLSSHTPFSFIFYRSYTHIKTQYEFVDNLQVAQGYVWAIQRVNSLIYTYTRSCVRTHTLSDYVLFFFRFLSFSFFSIRYVLLNSIVIYT